VPYWRSYIVLCLLIVTTQTGGIDWGERNPAQNIPKDQIEKKHRAQLVKDHLSVLGEEKTWKDIAEAKKKRIIEAHLKALFSAGLKLPYNAKDIQLNPRSRVLSLLLPNGITVRVGKDGMFEVRPYTLYEPPKNNSRNRGCPAKVIGI